MMSRVPLRGKLIGVAGVSRDISAHKRAEGRAELAASIDAGERQQIAVELERAVAQHQQEEAAFDALISVFEPSH
ncbi:hypothetical protein [Sinorhizobium medicae]